ncbi:MAG: DegT/DnrJ/EryC1/StrS family aminotransferase [Clostridia bacterium]|nr:DegT/DnrJ/EryC1/StrS family aminotransferase [Clostridia bacterium]
MQFRDLGAQYKALKNEIDEGIKNVIESSKFIIGPEVEILEKELANYVGTKHCVSCASGTDALALVLAAWGVGKGDAVFAPDFTFFATVNVAMSAGAAPVLVDIDDRTFNMSPKALEAAIEKTIAEGKLTPKVIIPVDLFGQSADYNAICKIADKYSLRILEDGAQGFGGSINGKRNCSFGNAAATSFFPAKPLGCYGDGGAIFTDDGELDVKLRSLRAQGRSPEDKYDNQDIGINSRLDTLQAAILLPKFHAFENYELDAVNNTAKLYDERLKDLVVTPYIPEGFVSSWAQYTVLLESEEQRNGLQSYLKQNGIPSMIYYPRGMHQQTAVKKYGFDKGDFPNTEKVVKTCLSLPMHPYLTIEQVDEITDKIREYFKK